MSGYSIFSKYYDQLIEADYDQMAMFISEEISKRKIKNNIVLDLACGTCNLTLKLAQLGYDMIGVDSSSGMLSVAREKMINYNENILLLCQEMNSIDLFGTVGAAACTLDSLNHISSISEISEIFSRVNLFLENEGIFIFDINTVFKHERILSDNIFVYDMESVYCVWQNEYDNSSMKTLINLDFFEKNQNCYIRSSDSFYEYAYSDEEISNSLSKNGFSVIDKRSGYTDQPATDKSERIVYITRKKD